MGGRWHLFYQGYPPEDNRQHWGHAVSDDLIRWRDLPYAIYPDPEECCYSGSALVEEDRVIAIYHGTQIGNMVALSSDPLLLNWEKVGDGAVIPMQKAGEPPLPYTVFDPCIWKKDGMYYALSGGWLPNGPANKQIRANFLFRSSDLEHWDYLHPFVEDDHYTVVGDDGACPYFWPIGDKHILLMYSHMTGGQYLLGDYDKARDKFVVTDGGLFNFGTLDTVRRSRALGDARWQWWRHLHIQYESRHADARLEPDHDFAAPAYVGCGRPLAASAGGRH